MDSGFSGGRGSRFGQHCIRPTLLQSSKSYGIIKCGRVHHFYKVSQFPLQPPNESSNEISFSQYRLLFLELEILNPQICFGIPQLHQFVKVRQVSHHIDPILNLLVASFLNCSQLTKSIFFPLFRVLRIRVKKKKREIGF